MILAIVIAWLAYKKASANGRNGVLWALAGAGVFIGTQIFVSFGIGIFLGVGIGFFGWADNIYETYSLLISVVAIVSSFLTSWLLLRYLDKNPEVENYTTPPSPPSFD